MKNFKNSNHKAIATALTAIGHKLHSQIIETLQAVFENLKNMELGIPCHISFARRGAKLEKIDASKVLQGSNYAPPKKEPVLFIPNRIARHTDCERKRVYIFDLDTGEVLRILPLEAQKSLF